MRDTCTATIKTGRTVWDPDTLTDVPELATIYTGECEVKSSEQVVKTRDGLTVEGLVVKIPVEDVLQIGAEVLITDAYSDPALVGARFTVVKLAEGSHITGRRYQVREVTGPDG